MHTPARNIGLLAIFTGIAGSPFRTHANPCGSADGESANTVSYLQGVVTRDDTSSVRVRHAFNLPATTPDSVVLVADTLACRRARAVYVRAMGSDTLRTPKVYTVKVGSSRYVISDGRIYGRATWDLVADTSFAVLAFLRD